MNNLKKSIMSVAMAVITAASPILSSYAAYASDITVNDDGTVTQISTSTEGSTSKADETKFIMKRKAACRFSLGESCCFFVAPEICILYMQKRKNKGGRKK